MASVERTGLTPRVVGEVANGVLPVMTRVLNYKVSLVEAAATYVTVISFGLVFIKAIEALSADSAQVTPIAAPTVAQEVIIIQPQPYTVTLEYSGVTLHPKHQK